MATISEIGICNIALQELGEAQITSFTEGTTGSSLCSLYFDFARNAVLEMHPWNFAIKRTGTLAQLSTAPKWGYTYAFQYPTDALRILETDDEVAKWTVETNNDGNKVIATDCSALKLRYVFEQTDVQKFSYNFVIALAKFLKMQLAIPITGMRERFTDAVEEFKMQMQNARTMDGQEGFPVLLESYDLESVR